MINSHTATKYTAIVLTGIAIISFLAWTADRDKKAMQHYENCKWVQVVDENGIIQLTPYCYE